jgi:hypothetical protein
VLDGELVVALLAGGAGDRGDQALALPTGVAGLVT